MFGASPFYRSYNPYQGFSPYNPPDLDRARALAAQRARRAQWLPDEYDDDVYGYNHLSPHESAYLNAHRNQALIERERQQREEEAQKRVQEEQRWQRELDRRQNEDEEIRKRIGEERERRRQPQQSAQRGSPLPTPAGGRIPFPTPDKPSSPKQPSPSPPKYDENHEEAASKLQRHFRIRQSVQAIKNISSHFDALHNAFTFPSTISFQKPSSPVTSTNVIDVAAAPSEDDLIDTDSASSVPKLAYNTTNYNLLAYTESLDKLLVKLDGVESWGDPDVRARRRSVVKRIEEEQARVDRYSRESWLKHIRGRQA